MFKNFEAIDKMKNVTIIVKSLGLKLKTFSTNQAKTSILKSYNLFYVYSSVILLQFAIGLLHSISVLPPLKDSPFLLTPEDWLKLLSS